jgi:hypothetical protein
MSPEQADSGEENIDTRTDVYSPGAVLFEPLSGTLPLDLDKLPYDEVLRRLRDEDVPRPSTSLSALGDKSGPASGPSGRSPVYFKSHSQDPGWSPDGSSVVFSTGPLVFDPGASTRSTIQILDLKSRQVSTLPDSEGFYAPR